MKSTPQQNDTIDWKQRSDDMHRRAQVAEGRIQAALAYIDDWNLISPRLDSMTRSILDDINRELQRKDPK